MNWDVDHTTGGRSTVRDVLIDAERRLAAAGVPSPNVDAAEIIAFVIGVRRNRLILQDLVTPVQRVRVEQLMTKRLSRVPLQHLLGTAAFRHIELQVGPGVFIPRPETELVVEAGIRELRDLPVSERIAVDLCSGSGAIALSLGIEVENSRVYAVELDDEAVRWTRRNLAAQEVALNAAFSRVDVVHDDAALVANPGHGLALLAGQVSVIVANPPYIPALMVPREPEVRDHEPKVALFAGEDGLDVVRGVLHTAAILLKPGGLLVIEHADVQGADAGLLGVAGLAQSLVAGEELALLAKMSIGTRVWPEVIDRKDLNGLPRFTIARRSS
ncbi:MAG: HemK family protein methyltransferase [Actinobacteria bacterium]|uniref:peptide chain release factor N(5)-glutamine methyltransferase n=1 Tax=freshwater metagenome TaxID=449393 RepID=A0A6J6UGS8_9ZZZZ|nr:HemK family protein methyltransferase [Actinomycetota bacterium]